MVVGGPETRQRFEMQQCKRSRKSEGAEFEDGDGEEGKVVAARRRDRQPIREAVTFAGRLVVLIGCR